MGAVGVGFPVFFFPHACNPPISWDIYWDDMNAMVFFWKYGYQLSLFFKKKLGDDMVYVIRHGHLIIHNQHMQ